MYDNLYGVGLLPTLTYNEATQVAELLCNSSNSYDAWYAHAGRLVRYHEIPSGARILRVGFGQVDKIVLAIQELGIKI